MNWLQIAPLRARALFRQRELDAELDEELQFHLEKKTAELVRDGFSPDEARRMTLAETGRFEQCKEECRDARGVRFLQETGRDFQFAARLLRKGPAFTLLAVSTLGLVLAANAIVFSFIDGLLFKPLPYRAPENRLVLIWEHFASQNLRKIPFSAPEVNDLRAGIRGVDESAAFRHSEYNVADGDEPERVFGAVVSWNLFSVLDAPPKFGRTFASEDAEGANGDVAIISETLWTRRFGSDPNIVGTQIHLSGRAQTVVGVMPAAFRFPLALFNSSGPVTGAAEIWKPIKTLESSRLERASRIYGIVARMSEGADVQDMNEELARRKARWAEQYPDNYHGRGFTIDAHLLRSEVVGRTRPAALIVGAAVFVLFLIALTNVVTLLLARAKSRERELAARIALGAGPIRMFRQFLVEGILLALLAAAAALVFAGVAIFALRSAFDLSLGRNSILFFLFVLAVTSGLALGVVPGLRVARNYAPISPAQLRHSHWWERVRDLLVVGETALALVLLVAAGLLAQSFLRLTNVPLGFNPSNVLTLEISLPSLKYPTAVSATAFFDAAAAEIRKTEGVASAAFASILPLSGINTDKSFTIEGPPPAKDAQVPDEEIRIVTPDYFAVLEIPLTSGRIFTAADNADAAGVVVINETFARRYWPRQDPLGKRIRLNESSANRWMEVVGVVGDVKHRGLDEPVRPEFYLPHAQDPSMLMTLVARTNRPTSQVLPAIRERVRSIDPEQPIANVRTMDQVVAHSIAPRRLAFVLVGAFAIIALLLCATGVYGIVSYLFVEQRREVALRIALGAARRAMFRLVVKRTLMLVGAGALIGLPIAIVANLQLAPVLYEVSPRDWPTLLGVVATLLSFGLIAAFIPASRAARINAMPLLRCD